MTFDGPITIPEATGVHYNTDRVTLARHSAELEPYRVEPATLQRVFAGDDAAAPEWTVALRFPDQKTADKVLGSLS